MKRTEPFACLPVALIRNAALSPQARCLYMILASYANAEQICWPSRSRLAADIGLSVRTVARLLKGLEGVGLIERKASTGRTTTYRLLNPTICLVENSGGPTSPERSSLSGRVTGVPATGDTDVPSDVDVPTTGATDVPGEGHTCPPTGDTRVLLPDDAPVTGDTDDPGGGHRCPEGDDTGVPRPVTPMSHRTRSRNYTIEQDQRTETEAARFDPGDHWPTLAEFLDHAARSGVPEEDARSIWESYTSVGWVDRNGNAIRHWGASLMAAWRYRQSNASPSSSRRDHETTITSRQRHVHLNPDEDPETLKLLALMRERRRQRAEKKELH